MAVLLSLTNLNHWSPAPKCTFVMTSPSTGYWKHTSNDRQTDATEVPLHTRLRQREQEQQMEEDCSNGRAGPSFGDIWLEQQMKTTSEEVWGEQSWNTCEKQMQGWAVALCLLLFLAWPPVGYTGSFSSRTKFKWNTQRGNISNYILKIEEIAKSLGPAVSSMLEVSATKQTPKGEDSPSMHKAANLMCPHMLLCYSKMPRAELFELERHVGRQWKNFTFVLSSLSI